MGDRTFSADDVLRIYADYLTEREMEIVENFFATEEMGADLPPVEGLLEVLENLLTILASPFVGAIAATFSVLARAALTEALNALRSTNDILGRIIQQGGVDA